jgi:hypothetical protein
MADTLWDQVKDFAYRHAPEPVRNWLDDRAAVARVTESLKQDLVQSGEWLRAPGDRTVPEEKWNSYKRYLDDTFKRKDMEAAREDHQRRVGATPDSEAQRQGNLWQQAAEIGRQAQQAASASQQQGHEKTRQRTL